MTTFANPIVVTFPSSGQRREFYSPSELRAWAEEEKKFWEPLLRPQARNEGLWRACQQALVFSESVIGSINYLETLGEQGLQQAEGQLGQTLTQITNGQTITRESRYAAKIRGIAESNPRAALAAYASLIPGQESQLQYFGIQPFEAFRLALEASLFDDALPAVRAFESEWSQLARNAGSELKKQEERAAEITLLSSTAAREEADRVKQQNTEWNTLKERVDGEWKELKRVYDNQLALLAPTQYWSDRAKSHMRSMIGLSIALGVIAVAAVIVFFSLGVPLINELPKDASAASGLLKMLPLLVPGFLIIWAMRIVSRLLSESISMMRDAREREAMVKTFLAMLREETTGQPGLTQDDRILILHSLFRPSNITATDDSPPVHWFDLLTKRLGQPGSGTNR